MHGAINIHRDIHHHRDSNRVNEEWFNDMDGIQQRAGLATDAAPASGGRTVQCRICFDSFAVDDMCAASCGHYFCKDCWRGYISAAINNGPTVLNMRCPEPDCKRSVCMVSMMPQRFSGGRMRVLFFSALS